MFLVIAFDFEKYHDEAEEIKNIIERYIYVDDEKAFKKCRKKCCLLYTSPSPRD